MVERALDSGKVVFLTETEVKRIFGDKFVKGITVLKKGKERNFAVAGVFIEIGSLPAKQIIVACGEGAKAILSAFEYLSKL